MAAEGTVEVDLSRDDAAWLKDLDGRRLQLLGRLAGGSATLSDDTKKVTMKFKDGPEEGGASWAEHCLKASLAMKNGETMNAPVLPETGAVWTPPVKVMKIPKDEAKNFLLGRGGARLREISDEQGVIAVFVQEIKPVVEKPFVIEAGVLLEAKYEGGDRWFEAEVKEVMEDKVKVRWTYDDDVPQSEVSKADVRALPSKPETIEEEDEDEELKVGALVEAKFDGKGERMFEAKVVKVDGDTVTVKWTYDDDVPESELDISSIKRMPKPVMEKLRIYGYDRNLLEAELKVLQCVDGKVSGFALANSSPTSEANMGPGLIMVPLLNNGEFKAKCVGQKGSMRRKIGKACGSALEYLGNDAFIVGTQPERNRTTALLELVQVQSGGEAAGVPKALVEICTRMLVPGSSATAVMGIKRANMNRVEEETSTLSFWVPTEKEEPEDEKMEPDLQPAVGEIYEARFAHPKGDRWFEAKVLKEIKGDNGTLKYEVEWQYDPDEEKSELPVTDLRKVGGGETAKTAVPDKTLAIFGAEASRQAAEAKVKDLIAGKDPWPAESQQKRSDSWSAEEPKAKKPKIVWVVDDAEAERRRKRAARFA
mmetsp:Transcript_125591/g.242132  ORF Transcript_125591/g.242132 Transcript_125591/m.242132 type:complete len:594 (-) Transcript_125591:35-1816(-)